MGKGPDGAWASPPDCWGKEDMGGIDTQYSFTARQKKEEWFRGQMRKVAAMSGP